MYKSCTFDIICFEDTSILTPATKHFLALPPYHQNLSFPCAMLSQHYEAKLKNLYICEHVNVISYLGGSCIFY